METEHTKGEWRAVKTKYRVIEIRNNDDIIVADIDIMPATSHRGCSYPTPYAAEANAQLIAAAPKLLDNLIRLIDRMEENDLGHMNAVIKAIKVVESATGMKYERTPNFK